MSMHLDLLTGKLYAIRSTCKPEEHHWLGVHCTHSSSDKPACHLQVGKLFKAQEAVMARDRKALLAEQQANLEQLITLISAGINRDLPLRVEQIVRAEVG